MKKAFSSLEKRFLKMFGDIKVFRYPLFMVYEPQGYRLKGNEIREVMDVVQPGDILVRGYISYLDGYFIPGFFSHAGLYVGEITEEHRKHISPKGEQLFKTGKQMVIHSMAEGVFMEDVINFCSCDAMAILRFPKTIKADLTYTPDWKACKLEENEIPIINRLAQGEEIDFAEIFNVVLANALKSVGKPYDFSFDFKNTNDLSCTEFVQCVYQCIKQYHQIEPEQIRVLIKKRLLLIPDKFVNSDKLKVVWKNKFAEERYFNKLKTIELLEKARAEADKEKELV